MYENTCIYLFPHEYECVHALTHKITLEKTLLALSIKGILALTIWWIFYTCISLPSPVWLFSFHWKSREWKNRSPGDVGYRHTHDRSGPTYIERSPAKEACDSHTHSIQLY